MVLQYLHNNFHKYTESMNSMFLVLRKATWNHQYKKYVLLSVYQVLF